MHYLTALPEIEAAIARFAQAQTLWMDTEVADCNSKHPKLSLVQILDDLTDLTGDRVAILDVLEHPEWGELLCEKIMFSAKIEKVFHNAKYDLNFLGKKQAQNVTCTLEIAKKIPYYIAPVPNHTLKTLAEKLCNFPPIDKSEQRGDWSRRPLTPKQCYYAKMDAVYVAQVHHRLLQLQQVANTDPAEEDVDALAFRYRQLESDWKRLNTEIEHLKKRLKAAMEVQNISDRLGFKRLTYTQTKKKISFRTLSQLAREQEINLDLSIPLTQSLQKELEEFLERLPVEETTKTISQLKISEPEEGELPF